jgi:hypothetical protein
MELDDDDNSEPIDFGARNRDYRALNHVTKGRSESSGSIAGPGRRKRKLAYSTDSDNDTVSLHEKEEDRISLPRRRIVEPPNDRPPAPDRVGARMATPQPPEINNPTQPTAIDQTRAEHVRELREEVEMAIGMEVPITAFQRDVYRLQNARVDVFNEANLVKKDRNGVRFFPCLPPSGQVAHDLFNGDRPKDDCFLCTFFKVEKKVQVEPLLLLEVEEMYWQYTVTSNALRASKEVAKFINQHIMPLLRKHRTLELRVRNPNISEAELIAALPNDIEAGTVYYHCTGHTINAIAEWVQMVNELTEIRRTIVANQLYYIDPLSERRTIKVNLEVLKEYKSLVNLIRSIRKDDPTKQFMSAIRPGRIINGTGVMPMTSSLDPIRPQTINTAYD